MNVDLTHEQRIVVLAALRVREDYLMQQDAKGIKGFKLPGTRHFDVADELANVRGARDVISAAVRL